MINVEEDNNCRQYDVDDNDNDDHHDDHDDDNNYSYYVSVDNMITMMPSRFTFSICRC